MKKYVFQQDRNKIPEMLDAIRDELYTNKLSR